MIKFSFLNMHLLTGNTMNTYLVGHSYSKQLLQYLEVYGTSKVYQVSIMYL